VPSAKIGNRDLRLRQTECACYFEPKILTPDEHRQGVPVAHKVATGREILLGKEDLLKSATAASVAIVLRNSSTSSTSRRILSGLLLFTRL
jgi:hypothetical protein